MAKKKKASTCWKGYVAKGKKKSPSGKKTKGGKTKKTKYYNYSS